VRTDATGHLIDYYPYGAVQNYYANGWTQVPLQFNGKELDAESGMMYYGARYLAPNLGRWMTPDWSEGPSDIPYASLTSPQTLNLYTYVGNNPAGATDLDGHYDPSPYGGLPAHGQGGEGTDTSDYTAEPQVSQTAQSNQIPLGGAPPAPTPPPQAHEKTPTSEQYKGDATYYNLPGAKTAGGEKFDPKNMAAAMTFEKADLGQTVTVTYTHTDKNGNTVTSTVQVVVNDRGPFARDSSGKALHRLQPDPRGVIDLTPKAFKTLTGGLGTGRVPVTVTVSNDNQ
jgi:RHS repeat-associated protein